METSLPYTITPWNDLPHYTCCACGYDTMLLVRMVEHEATCPLRADPPSEDLPLVEPPADLRAAPSPPVPAPALPADLVDDTAVPAPQVTAVPAQPPPPAAEEPHG